MPRDKRAYDFVLPLDRFDHATLAEAKKVLRGESDWLEFDVNGDLHVKNAHTTSKAKALREKHREELLEAIEQPEKVKEKITALRAQDPYAIDTPYMQQLADSNYGHEYLGLIGGERARKSEYEISTLERLLEIADMYPEREKHLSDFESQVAKLAADQDRSESSLNQPSQRIGMSILALKLRQISDVIPESEREAFASRLAKAADVLNRQGHYDSKHDFILNAQKEPEIENLDEERLKTLQAVASILARSISAPSLVAAREQFNQQVQLTVRAKTSPFMQMLAKAELEAKRAKIIEFGDEEGDWRSQTDDDVIYKLEDLQAHAQQLQELRRGTVTMPSEEEFFALGHDERAQRAWYNPKQVVEQMLRYSEKIEQSHPDIWRLHNSFPEAVNFIVANRHAKFLLGHDGQQGDIPDAAAFLGSEFLHHAGQVEMHVDPQLLAISRLQNVGVGV